MPKRILHYNWAQFDDPEFRGGGVSVYLRNLLSAMVDDPDYEFYVLSSGLHYTFLNRKVRYEETPNAFGDEGVRSFRILNSPAKAPAHDMFYDMNTWRSNTQVRDMFAKFLTDQGPFDTVVLHSMEGISSEVLSLKTQFPQTRFVYMWHNYMPICPQIELLHQNEEDCVDFEGGRKCAGCLSGHHRAADLIRMQRLGSSIEFARLAGRPLGNFLFGMGLASGKAVEASYYFAKDIAHSVKGAFSKNPEGFSRKGFQAVDVDAEGDAPEGKPVVSPVRGPGEYKAWREVNLKRLNAFDGHMVVSQLVADTITNLGVDPEKVHVTPLGMDLHSTPTQMRERAHRKTRPNKKVRLSFIGYGIPSKGLPFITKAFMEANAPILKERAELTIYARLSDLEVNRLSPLTERFADVKLVPGYQRKDLGKIARSIDLNIVPSIWRETYNQVGYELLCLGTPSLLSSTVGLGMFYRNHPDFMFESNNAQDFLDKLLHIMENPEMLDAFWNDPPKLPTMGDHIALTTPAMSQSEKVDVS